MEKNIKHIELIKQALKEEDSNIELISATNNLVYKVETTNQGNVYAKFYLNKSSHIDNEMNLYDIVDNKFLKEVIYKSKENNFTIFKELKGKTIDEFSFEQLEENKEKIVDSLIDFFESISKKKLNGYGLLDENLNGKYKDFKEFIFSRQGKTQEILKSDSFLGNIFTKIYDKYSNLIVADNLLVPIDTNMKNVMITDEGKVKFIDPGELISAPILMGYGDFVAHIYKTPLYDYLNERLNLSSDDEIRLRIYAIFSSLNVLAFLKSNGVDELSNIIPYGNKYTFFELIKKHLETLGL